MSDRAGDALTVLVFKDNLASRSFRVPLSWITRFGISVAILLVFSAICLFAAVKYFRVASQLNPARVDQLQSELDRVTEDYELKIAALQRQVSDAPSAAGAAPSQPVQSVSTAPVSGKPVLFADIPAPTSGDQTIPAEATLPFVISEPKTEWTSGGLEASFNIQYTNTSGGSQQGRIVVLARGPETLLAYPQSTFNRTASTSLINPTRGEYFSVSRFREVKATFPPVKDRGKLTEVEVVLFDTTGRVILHRAVPISTAAPAAAAPAPAAPATEAPAAPVVKPRAAPKPKLLPVETPKAVEESLPASGDSASEPPTGDSEPIREAPSE